MDFLPTDSNKIIFYRNILKDIPTKLLFYLMENIKTTSPNKKKLFKAYAKFCGLLIEEANELGYSGNIYKKHLLRLILQDENPFSLTCESLEGSLKGSMIDIMKKELLIINDLLNVDLNIIEKKLDFEVGIQNYKTDKNEISDLQNFDVEIETFLDKLIMHYSRFGTGLLSMYSMFKFHKDNGLTPVKNPDRISFNDIVGYSDQKDRLLQNTEAFLNGYSANNILLTGARGTGKSSCVKALSEKYFENGLRIIEVTKDQFSNLSELMNLLSKRGLYFIIFIDDLSFEGFEVDYKHFKSLLDGGTEKKPNNILFYATSNRRHIIQEKWSDRGSSVDDVHANDTMNEKISLSDRFGITLYFNKPDQTLYLKIVETLAVSRGIQFSEELRSEALQWEIAQKGLSGRTAKQFIDHYEVKQSLKN